MTLFAKEKQRHSYREQIYGYQEEGGKWQELGDWDWHMYTIDTMYKIDTRLPWWLSGKESACQCWRCGFRSGLEQSPGEGNDDPFQYSLLESLMDRGPRWARSYSSWDYKSVRHDLATKQL